MNLEKLEKYRNKTMPFRSNEGDLHGLFFIPNAKTKAPLKVICAPMIKSVGGWQHVSVSLPNRCPTWDEMCRIKDLFWSEDTTVIQFHPKKTKHINIHPYCLHLWRQVGKEVELPPSILV